jgi:exodeoxyribonuclease-3
MKIHSFNVNGLRAICKKGFLEWLTTDGGDIVGLQETKVWYEQLSQDIHHIKGYQDLILSSPERKGYSGVGVYHKLKEASFSTAFFNNDFDKEGRVIELKTPFFTLLNVYFPNGGASPERLDYKMRFYAEFLERCKTLLKNGTPLIVMGDVNTAHQEIDLAHPKENEKKSGFLPIERNWVAQFLEAGFIDTFRYFYPNKKEAYSWWDMKTRARERNVGWRIDYIYTSYDLEKHLKSARI